MAAFIHGWWMQVLLVVATMSSVIVVAGNFNPAGLIPHRAAVPAALGAGGDTLPGAYHDFRAP